MWLWSMLSIELRFVKTIRTRDFRRRLRGVVIGRLEMNERTLRWVRFSEILGWKGTRTVTCLGML